MSCILKNKLRHLRTKHLYNSISYCNAFSQNLRDFHYLNFLLHRLWNIDIRLLQGPSWSWLYGSWIYNYLCNQCLTPITLWVRITLRWGVLNTVCDKICQWLAAGRWFSLGTLISSTNKTDCHDIVESGIKHHNPNPNPLNYYILAVTTGCKVWILSR